MNEEFFSELQKMSREDEMRSKLLIRGLKRILTEKKQESLLKRMLRKKKHTVPNPWNSEQE
ncbi:hypothetical protein BC351_07560 [Paenibacillus ferrarius]|uniref:Uncharacterized protein n=1 Tax=Paenibacillus ferrarius TaxID=1469647 RepID=A0A1V4HCD0_9BACL|nr:hypothetical protein BC351_07560 [Paenibacillus ferrarius]